DLGAYRRRIDHRADETGRAMRERRHAIEEMRRVTGAAIDTGQALRVAGSGVTDGHDVPGVGQPADEIDHAVELRRNGEDRKLAAGEGDFIQNVLPGERAGRGVDPVA